jgi:LAS superfamily LD-carboxypeptidase LdcB
MYSHRRAAAAAADEGVDIYLDSGWRSPAYQQRLFDQAVAKYDNTEDPPSR